MMKVGGNMIVPMCFANAKCPLGNLTLIDCIVRNQNFEEEIWSLALESRTQEFKVQHLYTKEWELPLSFKGEWHVSEEESI